MTEQHPDSPPIPPQDGRTVTIRPLREGDRAALLRFGDNLHEDDWLYLEEDLRSPDIITRLINAASAENWRQLVALADGDVVGYSAVRKLPGWSSHVADIQLIVSDGWRRSGLGTALAQAIFDAARELQTSKIIVEMLDEHLAAKSIFKRLGFRVEGVLSDHAHDRTGKLHDMLILSYHFGSASTTAGALVDRS